MSAPDVDALAVLARELEIGTKFRPDDVRQAFAAVVELRDKALEAAAFLNALGRADRAEPLRAAAHRIRGPLEPQP